MRNHPWKLRWLVTARTRTKLFTMINLIALLEFFNLRSIKRVSLLQRNTYRTTSQFCEEQFFSCSRFGELHKRLCVVFVVVWMWCLFFPVIVLIVISLNLVLGRCVFFSLLRVVLWCLFCRKRQMSMARCRWPRLVRLDPWLSYSRLPPKHYYANLGANKMFRRHFSFGSLCNPSHIVFAVEPWWSTRALQINQTWFENGKK